MSYGVRLKVSGQYACFSRPEMKVERVSYDVITPSAARGVLEAIHWKPSIHWIIDRIHVLEPIKFQTIRRNEVSDKVAVGKVKSAVKKNSLDGLGITIESSRQQRAATVLSNVAYVIEAHFEFTKRADGTDTEGKHLDIFNRRAERGQYFHQPCLGMREFAADFELLAPALPLPEAISEDRDLGFMLWDIDHSVENRPSLFFRAQMVKGVIQIPQPGSAEILR